MRLVCLKTLKIVVSGHITISALRRFAERHDYLT
jgi:hypothetical protein